MLKFRQLPGSYAIVRLDPNAPIPDWATKGEFTSITRTAEELSIVCLADNVSKEKLPAHAGSASSSKARFPFSQTGVLLSFIAPLSNRGIPIFAISTYDTDYVLVQQEFADATFQALAKGGHQLK